MATLIAVYNSEGCQGRCDAKCYEAENPECECVCGGMNHGAGRVRAEANTASHAREMLENYAQSHPKLRLDFSEIMGKDSGQANLFRAADG